MSARGRSPSKFAAVLATIAAAAAVPRPVSAAAPTPAAARALDACRDGVTRAPDDYDAVFCYFEAARSHDAWDEALQALAAIDAAQPRLGWATLVAGHLHRYRQPAPDLAKAEAAYLRAARTFAAEHRDEGEILALTNLRDLLMPLGRVADASAHVARVVEIGRGLRNPVLQARVWLLEATHTRDTGGDLGHAYRLLRQVERAVFPEGPSRLRRTCLASLGSVAFQLGRFDEAIGLFTRLDALAAAEHDDTTRSTARFEILNTRVLSEELMPTPGGRARLVASARESLALADAARSDRVALLAHRILADLLAYDPASAADASAHAERCLAMATTAGQPTDEAACAWRLALLLHDRCPQRAQALQRRADRATGRANSAVADATSAGFRLRFAWRSQAPADAARESTRALAALETLRALQPAAGASAESFSTWTGDYYWLAGRLQQAGGDDNLAQAFAVVERLRARTLLEARTRDRTEVDPSTPLARERDAVARELAALQRQSLQASAAPAPAGRDARLADLEGRLQDLDTRLDARREPRRPAAFLDLAALQARLGPQEALLSYQLGLWKAYNDDFGGGAWLTVVSAAGHRVYRLPDRAYFAARVPVFNGLLQGDAGVEAAPAARLWADVFQTALDDLPSTTSRLIIVPDGPLHSLPFEALRASPAAPPLAARYEVEVAPSATLWAAMRQAPSTPARALVLADPALGEPQAAASDTRQAWRDRGVVLGPLPHTRRESRAAERALDGVDVLAGATASEHALKTRDLSAYGVVHVAAHALSDEAVPGRSAVVLAAGDPAEDGLLQPREIATLALEGKVVVLSACQTASGLVLGGEGVMSLARAFFEAGARTVVGTRWPVSDDGTARFFEFVYDALGDGLTVSAAIAEARRRAISAGLPTSVWAGVVLLGDGAVAPLAPRRRPAPSRQAAGLGVLVLAAGAGVALAMRQRVGGPGHGRA
ncbi:MAG: CHAT domain-containing protein [Vicinamibacterales bacterium]